MHNNLHHRDEFSQLLKTYRPSDDYIDSLLRLDLALLVAPVATGRNTIIRELIKLGNYHYLVSDTTRLKRVNDGTPERNGVEYWFKQEKEVLNEIKKGNYLGPAIVHNQQVSGVHISEIKKAISDAKVAITDIEIQGANEIAEYKKDVINIFLLPPSFEEWMRRLRERGAMEDAEKSRRLISAIKEIEAVLLDNSFELFINDNLGETVNRINNFIANGNLDGDSSKARKHAGDILAQLKEHSLGTLDA